MRTRAVGGSAAVIVALAAIALGGCGQVSPKQVRIESSALQSSATEAATVASELGKDRLPGTYAHVQFQKLAAQAGGPAASLGAGPAAPGVALLSAETQRLSLDAQREINSLAARQDYPFERAASRHRLNAIANRASEISSEAEAMERAQ
jgi:hypothetical protein